ncbi:unnamed protein product [Strongylus vulgaris]|uniref:PHD-type domain-containing protein n=1 Tax=Strongylus vulgaris TaxID=40348 RepID=A0A3P7I367_STRVU|nr:unnamed protein product [Strongylus vulgaris]
MLSAAIGPASPLGAESGKSGFYRLFLSSIVTSTLLIPDSMAAPSSATVSDMTLNPFRSSSPVNPASVVPDFNVDVYNMSEGISSPATTSDSARNSPFYPENSPSDVDEDFVPGSSRGGYTSRGRGGAKKKPGRGSSKSRGVKPLGVDSSLFAPPTRGKRGKRGSKLNGTGKAPGSGRGRGRGRNINNITTSIFINLSHKYEKYALLSCFVWVDETMLEDDEERNTRADDVEYVRTAVVCDAQDPYMQQASLCLVCGAIGKPHTQESSMIACCNCAQTFHTYCVGLHEKVYIAHQIYVS